MSDNPFNRLAQRYDAWFESEQGAPIFAAEVACVRRLLEDVPRPWLEVGVGTGRFAEALGVDEGIDPSEPVLEIAARRGVRVRSGQAEALPCEDHSFGGVVMVVTICFVQDPRAALAECARVVTGDGAVIVGLVPADSTWGRLYARQGAEGHAFYSAATFYTCAQIMDLASEAGLRLERAMSCLPNPPEEEVDPSAPPWEGVDEAAGFVAMRFVAG